MADPDLPDSKELIAGVKEAMAQAGTFGDPPARLRAKRRAAGNKFLDRYKPGIDQLTDISGAARFLGLKGPDSLRRRQFRKRADGTPDWPESDEVFGRSKAWTYRTIVLHQAEAPGRGHPGASLGRGRKTTAAE